MIFSTAGEWLAHLKSRFLYTIVPAKIPHDRKGPKHNWLAFPPVKHYFKSVGVVSAGFFYKDITDNIFFSRLEVDVDGEVFNVLQPVNGAAFPEILVC